MTSSRVAATQILTRLMTDQGSLTGLLEEYRQIDDYQFLQELCFGSCRWFRLLEYFLDQLLTKPIRRKDLDLRALLLIGLYQLRNMRVPEYAAINETVEVTEALNKPWARGFVNAVLRNFLRQQSDLEAGISALPTAVALSHPDWLLEEIEKDWPQQAGEILSNNNARAPMTLRVNLARVSRKEYSQLLDEAGIAATEGKLSATALYLNQPQAVQSLPGFEAGLVSVQDEASQLVPGLLQLAARQRVLDACAAPGGKTCHILESERSLSELVALDKSPERINRIHENLRRLQLTARVEQADASNVSNWWNGNQFDRILLDAPCSATGVIRRHPDIKLLRKKKDLDSLSAQQANLLNSLWPCLKPGGLLLYTSCSVLVRENDSVISDFLHRTPDAKFEGVVADWGVECSYGRQLLPMEENGPDGFFYSLLGKAS